MRRPRAGTIVLAASVTAIGVAFGVGVAGSDPSASPVPCDSQSASYDPSTGDLTYSGHCVVPQATTTVPGPTTTETTTETDTATVTQTVPGPTTTVTVTATPTPTPTPSTTPPPSGSYAPGEDVHASNTGYVGDGLTAAQLTPSGGVTYGTSFNGQTITGKAYTGTVNITGSNITVKDCSISVSGSNAFDFHIYGDNVTVDHCTITAGSSNYEGVLIEDGAAGAQVSYNDISRSENLITTYGASPLIKNNFLHASCGCGDPDGIELYGGSNVNIVNNRIDYNGATEAPINIAPWGSRTVNNAYITGNFLDYGQAMMLVDNQNNACTGATGNCLTGVVVANNAMGGHTLTGSQGFGRYEALENYENRPIAPDDATEAAHPNDIEWHDNQWQETQTAPALTPNYDGRTVLASCPSPC